MTSVLSQSALIVLAASALLVLLTANLVGRVRRMRRRQVTSMPVSSYRTYPVYGSSPLR